jgi:hypothetical protein
MMGRIDHDVEGGPIHLIGVVMSFWSDSESHPPLTRFTAGVYPCDSFHPISYLVYENKNNCSTPGCPTIVGVQA